MTTIETVAAARNLREHGHSPSARRPAFRHLSGLVDLGIERQALLRRCSEAPGGVVLFEAPAGFGKTHALAQWCHRALRTRHTVAWINLGPAERCPGALARRIIDTFDERGIKDLPATIPSGRERENSDSFAFVAALIRCV